ncbi:type 1 glutamine amidotransferase, partial [Sphingomonas sp.]|uniref:type 1 glutamine amidotransferase n=1 Tax=Sphingomonas sp. TaxID=28214 RepID=UPI0025CE1A76
RFLIAECEPAPAREKRRRSVGRSSGETYEDMLGRLAPGVECVRVKPSDSLAELPPGADLATFDAVFLTGSPLHLWEETTEARREVQFMRAVFGVGVPAFGSCAGLQLATVAAGGRVRPMHDRREGGLARRIFPTDVGRTHPLLAGRALAFDAPAIHTDEVEELPTGALLLASNATTTVQAAEIKFGGGVFWGVQYHPEISLFEVAAALRRQADDLVEHGLAPSRGVVGTHAALVQQLHDEPHRRDLAWRLGLDDQVTAPTLRSIEIKNFIERLVRPTRSARAKG